LRFASGAVIGLVQEQANQATSFSYLIPTLPDGATVAAYRGVLGAAPIALAHQDDLLGGQTNVALAIPDPTPSRSRWRAH
jgi:hypothetical protein